MYRSPTCRATPGQPCEISFNASADDGGGANDVNRYRVYRGLTGGPTPPACVYVITATDAASYSCNLTGLTRGLSYRVLVTAFDGVSESTPAGGDARPLDNLPPGPPQNVQLTDVPGDAGTALSLTFNASADDGHGANDVVRYRVYKRATSDPNPPTCIVVINATKAASYAYTLSGLVRGLSYNISVDAYDGVFGSAAVGANAAPVDNLPPGPPQNVQVTDVPGDAGNALRLTFNASADDGHGANDVVRYRVYKKATSDPNPPTCIVVISATKATSYAYTLSGLVRGLSYNISVDAYDGALGSAAVGADAAPQDNLPPGPPQNVVLADVPGDAGTALRLTFNASADDGHGANDVLRYRVYKKATSDPNPPTCFVVLNATKAASYAYTLTGLVRGLSYNITVDAYDGVFASLAVGGNAAAQDNLPPGPPQNVALADVPGDAGTALRLTFNASADDGHGANDVVRYRVYKKATSDPNPPTCIVVINATKAASYAYNVTGLARGLSYNISVDAYDGAFASAMVGANGVPQDNLPPGPPQNVALADVPNDAGTALRLTFNASADDGHGANDVVRYRVYKKATSDLNPPTCIVVINATKAASYAYAVTGLVRGLSYNISVDAYDGAFASAMVGVNGVPQDNLPPGPPQKRGFGRRAR